MSTFPLLLLLSLFLLPLLLLLFLLSLAGVSSSVMRRWEEQEWEWRFSSTTRRSHKPRKGEIISSSFYTQCIVSVYGCYGLPSLCLCTMVTKSNIVDINYKWNYMYEYTATRSRDILSPSPPIHTSSTLNADFSVHFGEIFNIRIVQWPESIKFQVWKSACSWSWASSDPPSLLTSLSRSMSHASCPSLS